MITCQECKHWSKINEPTIKILADCGYCEHVVKTEMAQGCGYDVDDELITKSDFGCILAEKP